ncbi:hypothetical protein NDU88_008377 [Pleurodeles waltl]|uniref:Uncharacterized protein n=1 Tax=Pleurodeles waltl TaxID=8319 RepID=A0AAV7N733_PLEWA|nr:hypothetical protein NDU88_008377 [Pleurodeles waltl]
MAAGVFRDRGEFRGEGPSPSPRAHPAFPRRRYETLRFRISSVVSSSLVIERTLSDAETPEITLVDLECAQETMLFSGPRVHRLDPESPDITLVGLECAQETMLFSGPRVHRLDPESPDITLVGLECAQEPRLFSGPRVHRLDPESPDITLVGLECAQ